MPTPSELTDLFEDVDTTTDNGTDDVDDTSSEDDTSADDTSTDTDDTEDSTTEDDKTTDDSTDDGYFADDEEDSTDAKTPEPPAAPSNFSAEDKFIVDNLPLISVRVVMADDSVKTLQVRSAAELPGDAKGYASFREGELFKEATTAQELKARELQSYYRQHQTTLQAQEFERKENQDIRDDIAELQRDGEIPKFKAQPGTRAFNEDPAAKLVQETIEFMNDRNAKYLERSNSGRGYRHIGFAEAFELMSKDRTNSADKNSSGRKDAAKKLVSKQGGSSEKGAKAPVSGRTIADVAKEFEDFETN